MFQVEWGFSYQKQIDQVSSVLLNNKTNLDRDTKRMLLSWSEHCLECAPPLCYQNCSKYLKRSDGKCRNLKYGMIAVKNDASYFGYGVLIEFRDWAKIESLITGIYITRNYYRFFELLNHKILKFINLIYKFIPTIIAKKRRVNGIYYFIREKFLKVITSKNSISYNCNVILECFSFDPFEVNYIVESGVSKTSIVIKPGYNYTITNLKVSNGMLIKLFPENNINSKIFIYDLGITKSLTEYQNKVKCVVWDLDNTLWNGIFLEKDGDVEIRQEIKDTILKLDSLGILNSISSKNSFEYVQEILKEKGLWEYFLVPKINWNSKSTNIRDIAKELNIGLDTILFVDDNPYERSEVSASIPEVEVVDEFYFPSGLVSPRFQLIATDESKNRRELYVTEFRRKEFAMMFNDDLVSFLYDCNMEMEVAVPNSEDEKTRAKELIQRTNQLNLSNNRYSDEEFKFLLRNKELRNYIFNVSDKFGQYGIVGFISFKHVSNTVHIYDLVISCRVVQKLIEKSLIALIIKQFDLDKDSVIIAHYNKSSKNGPILLTLKEIGFTEENDSELCLKVSNFDEKILPVKYEFRK